MAITYHAGRRIQATSTDFGDNGAGIPAISGGWKELGRHSGASQLDVSNLPDKRYYMVLFNKPSGNASFALKLNGDGNNNYSRRYSNNGGTDTTNTSQSALFGNNLYFGNFNEFMVTYIANKSDKEKLGITHFAVGNTTGSGNSPSRWEGVSKWANTLNAINRIQTQGTMTDSNSEMIVLGWDPDDTHTDNFWEELASVDLTGGANANLSSGTISAKKYLWVQYHTEPTSGTIDVKFTFNNDTGSNYADRRSINGSENTKINQDNWEDEGGLVAGETLFVNMFIINNASNEKLGIVHSVRALSGAGAGNAPQRREWVAKWANTSSQITEIDLTASSSTLKENSYLRVWGAD